MQLPKFTYFTPATIEDASSLLLKYRGEARVLAGGTDLLVKMKNRRMLPSCLINIKSIPDLDYIRVDEQNALHIGALVTLEPIKNSPVVQQKFSVLAQAAGAVGSTAIRNVATIGGNLCNASPSADTAPALLAIGAKVTLASPDGKRTMALADFFTGPGNTVLQPGEILIEIEVPHPPAKSAGVYLKHSLRQMDIAAVGVAVTVVLHGETCADVRIIMGAVAPTPLRASKAEAVVRGKIPNQDLVRLAGEIAAGEAHPIDDIRSSAAHRREVTGMLVAQAIEQAIDRARRMGP